MASAQIPAYEQFWLRKYNSLQSEYKDIISKHPDADKVLREVYKVLGDTVSLAGCTPANIGT
jgi:chaperonin cofactor prefoldin